jgi:exoribonuclease R
MVEECMLAANECAARFCIQNQIPALYRHHPSPPDYGLDRFKIQSALLGAPFDRMNPSDLSKETQKYTKNNQDSQQKTRRKNRRESRRPKNGFRHPTQASIKGFKKDQKEKKKNTKPIQAHQLSQYLNAHQNHPQATLLSGLLLRSMARALYLAKPGLHFGLGTQTYLHFTSPIRRYPDLWVHRQIKAFLNKKPFSNREDAQEVAAYASRRERLIMEAERKVMDAYKAVYMQAYIGHKFEGIICQSSPKGLTVELKDHPIWCWCGMEQLPRGLEYDEHRFAWVHAQHTLSLNLGQSVWVQIDSVSIIEGKIEITLIDQPQKEPENLLV